MEIPYAGLAVIDEDFNGFTITIPAKRNVFVLVFLSVWLCGWALGETFALKEVLTGGGIPGLFLIVWLCGWTIGGFFAVRTFWWNLAGKEVISIANGALTLDKRGALFYKAKTYDLHQAANFRAQEEPVVQSPFGNRRNNSLGLNDRGTIRFDYGMKTVKFADGIDEAEANFILQKLRGKRIIS